MSTQTTLITSILSFLAILLLSKMPFFAPIFKEIWVGIKFFTSFIFLYVYKNLVVFIKTIILAHVVLFQHLFFSQEKLKKEYELSKRGIQ